MIEFKIEGDYIELISLLKAIGIAQTGGHAKHIVEEEKVLRNGHVETRKRAKILRNESIEIPSLKKSIKTL
jgi:ribosome-associated protein